MKYHFGCLKENELKLLAGIIFEELKNGDLVLLIGQLGSGKTTFVKYLAPLFGVDQQKVRSPSFSLINIYSGNTILYHVDLYRLEKIDEEFLMELEEILEQKNGIILVEWADKLEKFWPKDCLRLYFDYCQHGRTVQIEVKIDILKKLVSRWSDCLQNSKN